MDRNDINMFEIDREGTIDNRYYWLLEKRKFLKKVNDKRATVLQIYNNAYYIAEVIRREPHPELDLNKYFDVAGDNKSDLISVNRIKPATMALVYNLLIQEKEGNKTIERICQRLYDCFLKWEEASPEAKKGFYGLILEKPEPSPAEVIYNLEKTLKHVRGVNEELHDIITKKDEQIQRLNQRIRELNPNKVEELERANSELEKVNQWLKAELEKDERWSDLLDDVFDERVNAEKEFNAIKELKSPLEEMPTFFVIWKVLAKIKWIKGSRKDFLVWIDKHFKKKWPSTKYKLQDINEKLKKSDINDWNENTMNSTIGKKYHDFAMTVLKTFTKKGQYKDIVDRIEFMTGEERINEDNLE